MKFRMVVPLAAMALLSNQAWADLHKGAYLGVGAGVVTSNITTKAHSTYIVDSVLEKDKSDSGFKFYGGYSFGYFGVELGSYSLGSYKYSGISGGSYTSDRFETKALALVATGSLPMGEQFALHGKLGVARMESKYACLALCSGFDDNSTSSIAPMLGLGLSWSPFRHFALRTDIESFRGGKFKYGPASLKANYELYTIGAEVRF